MSNDRDAYNKLFEHYDRQMFFERGIEDIIFIDDAEIKKHWHNLKKAVFENGTVYIRGYGRDAKGTKLYLKLYDKMFENYSVEKDPTNNAEPTKLLKNLTSYSKTNQSGKTLILNYQISHLFGKTKNPLLFTCPWNIAYIPKYLDPFTGHETQGPYSEQFKKEIFFPFLRERYKDYIEEYNSIIKTKVTPIIDESLQYVKSKMRLNIKDFNKFKTDVRSELGEIS